MTIVLIIGAWCVGKSTAVRNILSKFGVKYANSEYTMTNNNYCIIGNYELDKVVVGCDALHSTKLIGQIVQRIPVDTQVVILESIYLATTGINAINILFQEKFDKHLVCFLYADIDITKQRLMQRSGTTMTKNYQKKIRGLLNTLKRYKQIGLPIISIDTGKYGKDEVVDIILNKISTL